MAFRHPQAPAFSDRLAVKGLVGDVRPPDLLRFGLSPLYLRYEDVGLAVQRIEAALAADGFA